MKNVGLCSGNKKNKRIGLNRKCEDMLWEITLGKQTEVR